LRGGSLGGKFDENTAPSEMILRDHKARVKNPPSELETKIVEKLFAAFQSEPSLRMLKFLHIMSAREVIVPSNGERAWVLIVPFIEMKEYRKIQDALRQYMEATFEVHMVLIAHRRILPKEKNGHRLLKQKRPMSRTLGMVHHAWLEDILFPHEICSEHKIFKPNHDKPIFKIFLDPADREQCEHKLDMFAAVYKHLTGKIAIFEFLQLREGSELQKQLCPNIYPCDTAGYTVSEVPPKPLMPPPEEEEADRRPQAIEDDEPMHPPPMVQGGEAIEASA